MGLHAHPADRDPEARAVCDRRDSDLAAEMLKLGHAITLPEDRLIPTYAQLEKDARAAYRGIWASSFQMPWTFRQQASPPNKP